MHTKKILSAALTAALLLSGTCTTYLPQTTSYAKEKDSIHFSTGLGYYESMGFKSTQINSFKVPKGCGAELCSKDSKENGALAVSDPKTAKIQAMHQNMGWIIYGLKTGKARLNYKDGTKSGSLDLEVLPELKLKALKKSVKVKNGKLSLTVKYQNNSDTDIVIEGANINSAHILFAGEKEPSKEETELVPERWVEKKTTIPAGKTKSITFTCQAGKSGKVQKFDYPSVYFKYHGVYFSIIINNSSLKNHVTSYHGTMPLSEYRK